MPESEIRGIFYSKAIIVEPFAFNSIILLYFEEAAKSFSLLDGWRCTALLLANNLPGAAGINNARKAGGLTNKTV